MGRHARITSLKADAASASYLRYLKPGALARIRDSRISARNHRAIDSSLPIYSPHNSPAVPTHIVPGDGFPCSPVRIRGPRCLQRKKLVAAKGAFFSIPTSPVSQPHESAVDLFSAANSDSAMVAH